MLNRLLHGLQRLLYGDSIVIEPGKFERFLSPVLDPEHLPKRWR